MASNEIPFVLVVNASSDMCTALEKQTKLAFGSASQPSLYCRPDSEQHPRMRPVDRPQFSLIFVDCQPWIAERAALPVLKDWTPPRWLLDDVARQVPYALCVLLVPSQTLNAVNARRPALAGQLRQQLCVLSRELVTEDGFHLEVLDAWAKADAIKHRTRERFERLRFGKRRGGSNG